MSSGCIDRARGAAIGVLALVAIAAMPAAAEAISAPIQIANTSGEGVYIRPEPNTSRPALGWMPEGASPDYVCFAWGQNINGVPIWFLVNYNGKSGYYASYYDDSSYHSNDELTAKYGVPLCGPQPPQPAPAPAPAPPPAPAPAPSTPPAGSPPAQSTPDNYFFNRAGATTWALMHAKDPQAFGTMCAWFVSQALWAGGVPQSSTWNSKGPYRYTDHLHLPVTVPGTETAWRVDKLLDYLKRFGVQKIDITGNLRTNAVPQAYSGDIIAYDWGEGDGISHVSLVVGFAPGQYPEVAEMGQYDFKNVNALVNKVKHISSSYTRRGWTWSQLSGTWLQKKYPRMRAYLFHIPGGYN